jgi:UDP-N-acetyl-D-glucosamine dehydrogenase
MVDDVVRRFKSEDVTFGVIGLGYVGLPLAVEAAKSGLNVLGFDVNEGVVAKVNSGRSHIQDVPDVAVGELRKAGRLEATRDMSRLSTCDAISICVPTPLAKTGDPDVSYIVSATDSVKKALRRGQLVVLESTTYPGTTRELVLPELEAQGMKVGQDFFLCFSPERVDPANPKWFIKNTPKVIGGVTAACTQAGRALYERFIDTLVPVSSCEVAELTKLLENTFRSVNIGLVNETAIVADRLGVDVWEIIDAASTKPFGFMRFTPGPGLGGHCIPVDPHYLSWKMRTLHYKTRFIDLASEINAEMPAFVVGKVRSALNNERKAVRGSSILLLGVAYKRDIDDVRESPALDVMRLLTADGARVEYHDPHVPSVSEDGHRVESVPLTQERLASADAVVILTDHSSFDFEWIVRHSKILVDTRNATANVAESRSGRPQRWIVKGGAPA